MEKQYAIEQLGGTAAATAAAIGITAQAVSDWPDSLPPRISDRVQAALYRRMAPHLALSPELAERADAVATAAQDGA